MCHKEGINTCLDTSGSIINDDIVKVLSVTDRVLLDIKYDNDQDYLKYVGCSIEKPMSFLKLIDTMKIPTTLRNVVIPTLNDNEKSIRFLNSLAEKFKCVDKIELLPFKKICKVKYDDMNIEFRFDHISEPSRELMQRLNSKIILRLNL